METKTKVKPGINTGFLPPSEDNRNWVAGLFSGIKYVVNLASGNWSKFAPKGEKQSFRRLETMACVSYSTNDNIETQINKMIREEVIDTTLIKDWIDESGDFNLSDRLTAKGSGTTLQGNYMDAPIKFIKDNGGAPEKMWPAGEDFDWDEYYKEIPQNVKDKAKELLQYFEFNYEQIPKAFLPLGKNGGAWVMKQTTLQYHLKQSPLVISTGVCPGWFTDDVVQACNIEPSHATCLLQTYSDGGLTKAFHYILDHYVPFLRKLSWFYPISYAMKIVVTPKDIIIKKKEDMTIYKAKGNNTCYELWADGLFHPIVDGSYVQKKWGGWSKVSVKELEYIDSSKIGSYIGEVGFIMAWINKKFGTNYELK